MCGIVGVMSQSAVNQLIYDALLLLQHRGQDAAGIVTMQGDKYFMHKARGILPAMLQEQERVIDQLIHRCATDNANNSTHSFSSKSEAGL